jgi:hypothetical protein
MSRLQDHLWSQWGKVESQRSPMMRGRAGRWLNYVYAGIFALFAIIALVRFVIDGPPRHKEGANTTASDEQPVQPKGGF